MSYSISLAFRSTPLLPTLAVPLVVQSASNKPDLSVNYTPPQTTIITDSLQQLFIFNFTYPLYI